MPHPTPEQRRKKIQLLSQDVQEIVLSQKVPAHQKSYILLMDGRGITPVHQKKQSRSTDLDYSSNQEIRSTIFKGSFAKVCDAQFSYQYFH